MVYKVAEIKDANVATVVEAPPMPCRRREAQLSFGGIAEIRLLTP
jgi:hypothetical protein